MESRPRLWAGRVGEEKKEVKASVSSSRMEKGINDQGITKVEEFSGRRNLVGE